MGDRGKWVGTDRGDIRKGREEGSGGEGEKDVEGRLGRREGEEMDGWGWGQGDTGEIDGAGKGEVREG